MRFTGGSDKWNILCTYNYLTHYLAEYFFGRLADLTRKGAVGIAIKDGRRGKREEARNVNLLTRKGKERIICGYGL